MRKIDANLAAHLQGGTTTLCWCWKLIRRDGVALGFTDHDRDLVIDGLRHAAASGFTGSEIEEQLGLAPDNLSTEGALSDAAMREADIAAGIYDGAAAEIWLVNWADVSQRLLLRKGSLGEISRSGSAFSAEIKGVSEALNRAQGRIFQAGCDAVPGDSRCGVNLSLPQFRGQGVVTAAAAGGRILTLSGIGSYAANWFTRGLATLSSGEALEVKFHEGARVELWRTPSRAPATGEAVVLLAGCDRTLAMCKAKFANAVNFRGFPHMPGNDYLASYPVR